MKPREWSRRETLALLLLATAAGGSCEVHAQSSSGSPAVELQRVVVTAPKTQAQAFIEAPLTVQVFSGEELSARNITTISDLVTAIPGAAQGEQLGDFIKTFSIRGSGAGGAVGDALVGYYVDDIPYVIPNYQAAPTLRLQDLERVEVLRGPYGTLYGQGAMGGTLIFHTRNPDLHSRTIDIATYLSGTQGSSNPNYGLVVGASIPIIDNQLALRVTVGGDYRAGYADVYSGEPTGTPRGMDANFNRTGDLRVVLFWKPNERLNARVQVMRFGGKQGYSQQMSSVQPHHFANWGDVVGYEHGYIDLTGLSAEYKLDWATLTSATGYTTSDIAYRYGLLLPPLGGNVDLFNGYKVHSFVEEVRLASRAKGPLHWMGGVFYNNATNAFTADILTPTADIPIFVKTKTNNAALFGEVSYDLLGGKLVPLAGLRLYRDHRDFDTAEGRRSSSAAVSSWRLNLSYHPDPNMTAYINAGTGFRSGIGQSPTQVDSLRADGIDGKLTLDPDRVRNVEIGIKGIIRRGARLQYDVSVYDLHYKGLQTTVTTTGGINAFASLGDAQVRGLDLQLQWRLDGLTLGFAGNINKNRYTHVNPGVAAGIGAAREGGKLLETPRYTARLDAGYSWPTSMGAVAQINAGYSVSGRRMNQAGDETPVLRQMDATIGASRGAYSVELYGTNLTGEAGPWYIRAPGLVSGPVPRTLGVRVRATL